jgi:hypothetical protein
MKKCSYTALLLLIAGGGIYATCRQDVIFLAPFHGTKLLELIKIDIQYQNGNIFTYFLLFCLADVLWYIALLLLQVQFYNRSMMNKILFYCAVALPFILEFLQYFKIISGTFDIVDIMAYLITFLIFLVVWKRNQLLVAFRKSR